MRIPSLFMVCRAVVCLVTGSVLVGILGVPQVFAQGDSASDATMTRASKGFDESKVKADPICDSSKRPQISKVEPDDLKVGDTVVITGKDFGRKAECFHGVSFGAEPAKVFSYIDDGRAEATVPEFAPAGLTFLNVVTSGGTARKGVLIQGSK